MVISFGNQLAEDLFYDKRTKTTRSFPPELLRVARRKILYLHDADEFMDMKVPPGNRLEALKGFHSIRINDQWRLAFEWQDGGAYSVQVIDYHK